MPSTPGEVPDAASPERGCRRLATRKLGESWEVTPHTTPRDVRIVRVFIPR
jgi:hypothetical protein